MTGAGPRPLPPGGAEGGPPGPRVLHVIPSLRQGGAEAVLAALVRATAARASHHVFTLLPARNFFGVPREIIVEGTGIRGRPSPRLLAQVRRAASRLRPDVIHAWMYHANLLSAATAGLGIPVVWAVHNTLLRPGESKASTRAVNLACAALSRWVPERIVYVSQTARDLHEGQGYAADRGCVVPNGVDLEAFDPVRILPHPAVPARPGMLTFGMVARNDPGKGHAFLVDAVAGHPRRDRIALAFVGEGCDGPDLADRLARAGLLGQSVLMGAVREIAPVYAALDVLVLASFAEALPMSVLEGAAMDRVVCASRVGDVPLLGLPEELLFRPGDLDDCRRALSAALDAAERGGRSGLRRQVAERFDLTRTGEAYLDLYAEVARLSGRAASRR